MSSWYDPYAERYRSTLPHKLAFGFGWPVVRWVMFHSMPCETAHHSGIRALQILGWVDAVWSWLVLPFQMIGLCIAVTYLCALKATGRVMVGAPLTPAQVRGLRAA